MINYNNISIIIVVQTIDTTLLNKLIKIDPYLLINKAFCQRMK